jgi:hypothetical protein
MEQDLAQISCVFPLFLFRSPKSLDQFLRHMPTVAHGHRANDPAFLIDGIDDAKATHAILLEPIKFPLERLSTCGTGGNGPDGRRGKEGKGEDVKRKT